MKKFLQLVVMVVIAASLMGCASSKAYWVDRGRDATDIITVTGGVGAGAKARVGFLQLALFWNRDCIGLRNGVLFQNPKVAGDCCLLLPWVLQCSHGPAAIITGGEEFYISPLVSEDRHKKVRAGYAFPGLCIGFQPHYYTQIEVAVGLGPSLRLGANPGELLDFMLGWVGIDMFDDDLAKRREEIEAEIKMRIPSQWSVTREANSYPRVVSGGSIDYKDNQKAGVEYRFTGTAVVEGKTGPKWEEGFDIWLMPTSFVPPPTSMPSRPDYLGSNGTYKVYGYTYYKAVPTWPSWQDDFKKALNLRP